MKSLWEQVTEVESDVCHDEAQCLNLVTALTIGEDKRLAATARTQLQIGRLLLKELAKNIEERGLAAEKVEKVERT